MSGTLICPTSKLEQFPWETVNALGPHIIWLLFAAWVLWWIGPARMDVLLASIQKFKVSGIEFEFQRSLELATEARGGKVSQEHINLSAKRLVQSRNLTSEAKILWIDDTPENNTFERTLFEKAGANITVVVSSEKARRCLEYFSYDIILSDIRRDSDDKAGIHFLQTLCKHQNKIPIIFYVGKVINSVPTGAFGITDSPDELVHLVLDALARCRS